MIGNLNFVQPSGLLQACNGTDLPFITNITRYLGFGRESYETGLQTSDVSFGGLWARWLSRYSDSLRGWTVRGLNPGGGEIFRMSRPALGPTKILIQWVPGLSRGYRAGTWRWTSTPTRAEVKALLPLWGGFEVAFRVKFNFHLATLASCGLIDPA